MPKSGHKRRQLAKSKKKANKLNQVAARPEPAAVEQTATDVTFRIPAQGAPPVKAAPVKATAAGGRIKVAPSAYAPVHVNRELKRIGILTAVIVIILVVLSRVLPNI